MQKNIISISVFLSNINENSKIEEENYNETINTLHSSYIQ